MLVPFAVELYRRYVQGQTVEQLAKEFDIPPERIEQRLRAAAEYLARHTKQAA